MKPIYYLLTSLLWLIFTQTTTAQPSFTQSHFISCDSTFVSDTLGYPTWNPPSIVQAPTHGTVQFLGDINFFPTFQYTPNSNFEGIDTVIVACAQATQISCTTGIYVFYVDCGINSTPIAQSDTLCSVGGLQAQSFPAFDPDGDPLNYFIVQPPTAGNVTINANGTFDYEQQGIGFWDSFSFKACDPSGTCGNATIHIVLADIDTIQTPQPTQFFFETSDTLQLCGGLGYALQHNGEPNLFTVFLTHNASAATLTYLNDDCIIYTPLDNLSTDIITVTGCGDAPPPTFYTCQGMVQLSNCSTTEYIITNTNANATTHSIRPKVQLLPNPAAQRCQIVGIEQFQQPTIQLFYANGQLIDTYHSLNDRTIDLQNLPNGLYWVQITDNTHHLSLSLIKQ